jgi:hypothetical protein
MDARYAFDTIGQNQKFARAKQRRLAQRHGKKLTQDSHTPGACPDRLTENLQDFRQLLSYLIVNLRLRK